MFTLSRMKIKLNLFDVQKIHSSIFVSTETNINKRNENHFNLIQTLLEIKKLNFYWNHLLSPFLSLSFVYKWVKNSEFLCVSSLWFVTYLIWLYICISFPANLFHSLNILQEWRVMLYGTNTYCDVLSIEKTIKFNIIL